MRAVALSAIPAFQSGGVLVQNAKRSMRFHGGYWCRFRALTCKYPCMLVTA